MNAGYRFELQGFSIKVPRAAFLTVHFVIPTRSSIRPQRLRGNETKCEREESERDRMCARAAIESKLVRVFTEGACFFSGTRRECGALGVYVSGPSLQSYSRARFVRGHGITNQSMQLEAVKQGLTVIAELQHSREQQGLAPIQYQCVTSSAYVIKFLYKWSVIWERTGWMTKNKQDVKNALVLRDLLDLSKRLSNMTVIHWARVGAAGRATGPSDEGDEAGCDDAGLAGDAGCAGDDGGGGDCGDGEVASECKHGHRRAMELAAHAAHEGGRIGCRIARGLHLTAASHLCYDSHDPITSE